MAHNLATKADGSAAMMYVGETPWHGLGTQLDNPATSAEAMIAAGLNFEIRMEDILTSSGLKVPMGQAAVRADTGAVLGMVGRRWTPVQNSDAFNFLDGVVGEGIRYHTAGALGQGQRVWMLAKLPTSMRISGSDDVVDKFLLLSNAHDGFSSLRAFFTPIRVVCQNTLSMAERTSVRQGVVIRHTGNLASKMDQARQILGIADSFYADLQTKIDAMAARKMNRAQVAKYFEMIAPAPPNPEEQKRADENAKETRQTLMGLFETGKGNDMKGVRGSLWAAYNSVTEFVDHTKDTNRTSKLSLEQAAENRLTSIWFGNGASLKGRAFEAAMAMVSGNN